MMIKTIVLDIVPDFCWVTAPDIEKMFFLTGFKSSHNGIHSVISNLFRDGKLVRRGPRGSYQYLKVSK